MIILGLHFGHDAAVSVVKDGRVLLCVERERLNRVKHAITLTSGDILRCLDDLGLRVSDIDLASLTTTQGMEYVFPDPNQLSIDLSTTPNYGLPCTLTDVLHISPMEIRRRLMGDMLRGLKSDETHYFGELLPEWRRYCDDPAYRMGDLEDFVYFTLWDKVRGLNDIAGTDYRTLIKNPALRFGFHYPAVLRLMGREIPGYVVAHHIAHVAYSYYQSPYSKAAILSADGSEGSYDYQAGFFAFGDENRIYPISPNHLNVGQNYDFAAVSLGFGLTGGAGKLMGLSAYGKPFFFRSEFIGNWYDLPAVRRTPEDWTAHCMRVACDSGYDLAPFGDPSRVLEPICTDYAASTQKLTEEVLLAATRSLDSCLEASGLQIRKLCMAGGVALNCPANTRLLRESPFREVFVPPAVMDSGLAMGSALWLYHNVMDQPRSSDYRESPLIAYLGMSTSADKAPVESALEEFKGSINTQECNAPRCAAADLAADQVIGWFQERSEIGPRALGHRSILANPTHVENWKRVNGIKKREFWRPLAPAVLQEEEHKYFNLCGRPSYFMLFNANVSTGQLPATTHVDGSARIQSVTPQCGQFYSLIREFHALTGVPAVLNTSFNGRGQPIIETPKQAIEFLLESSLDALYLNDYRLTRVDTEASETGHEDTGVSRESSGPSIAQRVQLSLNPLPFSGETQAPPTGCVGSNLALNLSSPASETRERRPAPSISGSLEKRTAPTVQLQHEDFEVRFHPPIHDPSFLLDLPSPDE